MRLLLVEDDLELAKALAAALARRGMASDHATGVDDAMLMLEAVRYGAVILDLGLPDADGMDILRNLRARHDPIPVLILTARSDVGFRVDGLEAGADDYLVKPFAVEELVARLRAVLRRPAGLEGSEIVVGNLSFATATRSVAIGGVPLALSMRETELIDLLLRRTNHVVPKRLVEDQLFGMSETFGSNAVEVYVHRVRRKLEQAAANVRIETIRGVGYMLRCAG